jgi:2-polyprenyl-3-methyl-5-hydroxy-6-metoxy-1,4-benzoquinol methylase
MRSACLLAVTAVVLTAQSPPSEEAIFKDFLTWYKTYAGSPYPDEIRKAYSQTLAGRGLAAPEVERQVATVDRIAATRPQEFIALNFDKLYSSPNPPFKREASQYLVRAIEDVKPGRALDVAMGQGRNSLFLASKGWDVTGYDLSEGGLDQARTAAAKAGLKINTVRDSHEKFDYGREQWDLIVEAFAFTDLSDHAYRRRVVDSLKPGGMLVIEGFGDPSGQLKNSLIEAFRDLKILSYENRPDIADWSLKKAPLERMVAQKN